MAISLDQLLNNLVESGLFSANDVAQLRQGISDDMPARQAASLLVDNGQLSHYQAEQLLAGKTTELVLGEYTVIEPLGAGGMGQVFRGRHNRLKRDVAIKVLQATQSDSAATIGRFQREMEALARLEHPNIVIAHDAGEVGGKPYLVMQYVEGEDLATAVRRQGPLSVEEAVDVILQAARGIEYAHGEGIIHRDVKPSNLLRDKRGTVKVLDMGLARLATSPGEAATADALTATGQIMGTVDFMAPEQAENTHKADERSDIYALGCTLYNLLSGSNIYEGDSIVTKILAHRERPVPSLLASRADVPSQLDAIYQRMVAKRPEDRYASMAEVITALQSCPGAVAAGPGDETVDLSAPAAAPVTRRSVKTAEETPKQTRRTTTSRSSASHETVAFNKRQKTQRDYRVPAAPRRRRRRRGPLRLLVLLVLLLAVAAALMLSDDRFDYLQLRGRLGLDKSVAAPLTGPGTAQQGISHFVRFKAHDDVIVGVAVSPDSTRLASAAQDVKTWTLKDQKHDLTLDGNGVRQLLYSANGHWIAVNTSLDVKMWDAISGDLREPLARQFGSVSSIAFSPDSQLFVTADRQLMLWEVDTGKLVGLFDESARGTSQMAFSPDGSVVVSAHVDGTLRVWNVETRRMVAAHDRLPANVTCLAFSPQGTLLATGDKAGNIAIWTVAAWKSAGQLFGHKGAVTGLGFLPDGHRLLSTSRDGTLRLWNATETAELAQLKSQSSPLTGLAISAGGRRFATASEDGHIDVWDVATEAAP
jgi:serine/threonine protein kinase